MDEIAHPYVYGGLWMARCPRLAMGCHNAEHYGPAPISNHVGGLTETSFRCNHCTFECPVQWPAEREAITRLLAQRPVPSTRNWNLGEPVQHLVAENIEHGLIAVNRGQ